MNERLEDVRRDIEETRAAMDMKIAPLKDKLETTARTTLNPAYLVRTRPLQSLGVFVVGGLLVKSFLKAWWRGNRNHGAH